MADEPEQDATAEPSETADTWMTRREVAYRFAAASVTVTAAPEMHWLRRSTLSHLSGPALSARL
jgi:hypothetical protein